MDQFNKALSFILGLIVVAVFIVVVSGKFNFKSIKLPSFGKNTVKTTPTPTQAPARGLFTTAPTAAVQNNTQQTANNSYKTTTQTKGGGTYTSYTQPSSIPNTGIPALFVPIALSALAGGIYLRKKN